MTTITTYAEMIAEASRYAQTVKGNRTQTQTATARAGLVMYVSSAVGVKDDETGEALSDNDIIKAFQMTKGTGHRAMRVGRLLAATGVASGEDFAALSETERSAARDLVVIVNRTGVNAVTEDMESDAIASKPETVRQMADALAALVEEALPERKEEAKAAREERKAEAEHAESPEGHADMVEALVAYFEATLPTGAVDESTARRLAALAARLSDAVDTWQPAETEAAA